MIKKIYNLRKRKKKSNLYHTNIVSKKKLTDNSRNKKIFANLLGNRVPSFRNRPSFRLGHKGPRSWSLTWYTGTWAPARRTAFFRRRIEGDRTQRKRHDASTPGHLLLAQLPMHAFCGPPGDPHFFSNLVPHFLFESIFGRKFYSVRQPAILKSRITTLRKGIPVINPRSTLADPGHGLGTLYLSYKRASLSFRSSSHSDLRSK